MARFLIGLAILVAVAERAFACTAGDQTKVLTGVGTVTRFTRRVGDFSAIEAEGGGDFKAAINVNPGFGNESVALTIDQAWVEGVRVEVVNSVLRVGIAANTQLLCPQGTTCTVQVDVNTERLDRVHLRGNAVLTSAGGQTATSFTADVGDNAFATLSTSPSTEASFSLSGGASLILSGDAPLSRVRASHDATLYGNRFRAQTAIVDLRNQATVFMGVTSVLNGTVRDSASMRYIGQPQNNVVGDAQPARDGNYLPLMLPPHHRKDYAQFLIDRQRKQYS